LVSRSTAENSASSESPPALPHTKNEIAVQITFDMSSDAQQGKLIPIDPDYADLDGHVTVAVGDMIRGRCASEHCE
jgi:hypothetical protein